MNHHIDDEAEDKATRKNEAAAMAAQHDFEHWSKTGEVRRLPASKEWATDRKCPKCGGEMRA